MFRLMVRACFVWALNLPWLTLAAGPTVYQSARDLPVAASVDVVVVGGSTGAVSAAVAAAKAGVKVFLVAPRSYLGDDMTATLRLWLEEGERPESPLAKAIFDDREAGLGQPDPNRIPFQYEADRPSGERHRDTKRPSLLADLVWGDAATESVEFGDDVNLTIDLGRPRPIVAVRVHAYHQLARGGYRIGSIAVSTSDDKLNWKPAAVIQNDGPRGERSIELSATVTATARYLKLFVRKAPGATRVLLGEIEVVGPPPEEAKRARRPPWPRPMHVKQVLDAALLEAKVPFLYNCQPTDLVVDANGRPAGVVVANRAGRQAVIARTIVDATVRGMVARMAGAEFRPYPPGLQMFKRVVIGGEVREGRSMIARVIAPPFVGPHPNRAGTPSGVFPIIEYTLEMPMRDASEESWADADQTSRVMTYHPHQQFTSDVLFQVPPYPLLGRQSSRATWRSAAALPLDSFRPKRVDRVWILGGCADLSREQAEKLLRPLALIEMGARIGAAVAAEARATSAPKSPEVKADPAPGASEPGDVREALDGVRPALESPTIHQDADSLDVLGRWDVVVVGGGTAGAPAAIAAARQGAKTLVIEQLSALGGVGTAGAISTYCAGNRVGFTAQVGGGNSWVIEQKIHWWRTELLKANADIWCGVTACGAFVDRNRVRGVVVATSRQRGVVLAKVVIDATGNADVAAAAGAECVYTDGAEFAMQGTGLPPRQLGATYANTDYLYTDETDLVDVWQTYVYARDRYRGAFDLGQLVDTRERRRIAGDFTLTILDQVSGRTYPDTICQSRTGYDTHGPTVAPLLLLRHPGGRSFASDVPYRCLLPKEWEGLLVTGIGLSAHRDAQPLVRMQPDVQNQGYAAGAAAAMAARKAIGLRAIDIRALQRHLVEIGNLEPRVLTDQDSFPLPQAQVAEAVDKILDNYRNAAVVLAHSEQSLPRMRAAYARAEGDKKLLLAKLLGMLGDATGVPTLVAELNAAQAWDQTPDWRPPKDFPRRQQIGWEMSNLDNTLVALSRTRSPEALPAALAKLALLRPESGASHHRAVYSALAYLADPRAAKPLAELLRQPGIAGHAITTIHERDQMLQTKSGAVRELTLARALYRCGDHEGLAERTLRQYAVDLRGHFARHAKAVLTAGKPAAKSP
jgi:flavin-dependent dehydrogenase